MNLLGGRIRQGALTLLIVLTAVPAAAHESFEAWADAAHARAVATSEKSFPMKIEDRFPARLALGGIKAETACSGSIWVYDYTHHIAAGYDGGPEMVLSIGDPPIKLPSRNLSHESTSLGIHLGETPEQVAAAWRVPLSDVRRTSHRSQLLSLRKPVRIRGDMHIFYDLAVIVFDDGRAVSIWLAHDED